MWGNILPFIANMGRFFYNVNLEIYFLRWKIFGTRLDIYIMSKGKQNSSFKYRKLGNVRRI